MLHVKVLFINIKKSTNPERVQTENQAAETSAKECTFKPEIRRHTSAPRVRGEQAFLDRAKGYQEKVNLF